MDFPSCFLIKFCKKLDTNQLAFNIQSTSFFRKKFVRSRSSNCDSNLSITYTYWYTLLVVFNHCETRILFITGPWRHNSAACSIIRTWSCLADILRQNSSRSQKENLSNPCVVYRDFLWKKIQNPKISDLIRKYPIFGPISSTWERVQEEKKTR